MRQVTWPILLACLTVPVFGQETPQTSLQTAPRHSIYENLATAEAIGGPVTTAEPSQAAAATNLAAANASNPQQNYDQAADSLTQARTDVVNRLANEPNYQTAARGDADSKKKYDDEIDDALSALSYDDTYNDLINAADRAGKNLQSLSDLSPGQPDAQAVRYAQERVDDARRQVEQYEDDALDNDKYVQQARQNYLAARAARDKILADAYAADPKVQQAQGDLQRAQVALNAASGNAPAANSATNPADQQSADQTTQQQPYVPTGTQLEPQYVPQAPVVYDNGDSTAVAPDYNSAYQYPAYAYAPVVDASPDYGYAYFPSFFIYDRSFRDIRHRYHDDHDRDRGHDDWRFHTHDGRGNFDRGDFDRGDFDHSIADRRARFESDWNNANRHRDADSNRANWRDGSNGRDNTDAARLANDRQQANDRDDSNRQRDDYRDRTRQWVDSPKQQVDHDHHDRSNKERSADDRSTETQRERDAQAQEQARQADQARQDAAQQAQARQQQQSHAHGQQQADAQQQHAQQAPAPHAQKQQQQQQSQQSQQSQQNHDSSAHRSFGDSGHSSGGGSGGGGGGHSSSHSSSSGSDGGQSSSHHH